MIVRRIIFLFTLILVSLNSFASDINISEQYVRETIPGTKISSAYLLIENNSSKDIKLLSVISKVSERIELHEHIMTEEMMQMQQVKSIIIKARGNVKLQPHGYHIMIFDLDNPLIADTDVSMTFGFDNAEQITVKMPVKGIQKQKHHH